VGRWAGLHEFFRLHLSIPFSPRPELASQTSDTGKLEATEIFDIAAGRIGLILVTYKNATKQGNRADFCLWPEVS
jgi:hypothetical protein